MSAVPSAQPAFRPPVQSHPASNGGAVHLARLQSPGTILAEKRATHRCDVPRVSKHSARSNGAQHNTSPPETIPAPLPVGSGARGPRKSSQPMGRRPGGLVLVHVREIL